MSETNASPEVSVPPGEEWLKVESLDLEAQGVAHRADGKVVFIDGALPGEEVRVQTGRRKNNWEQATITEMRSESAQRVRPQCEFFGVCGGCKMQHLEPSAQVAVKQRVLEARKALRESDDPSIKKGVAFFDPDSYNAAASIQDNILFGKVAYGQARAGARLGKLP